MRLSLTTSAVLSTLMPPRDTGSWVMDPAILTGTHGWPHGTNNAFLARGPLTLRQHGLTLGVTDHQRITIERRSSVKNGLLGAAA